MPIISIITGCWFQPLWKIWVSWDDYSQYMEKNHVPNHQPEISPIFLANFSTFTLSRHLKDPRDQEHLLGRRAPNTATAAVQTWRRSTGFCHLVISDVQNLASYPCNLEGTCWAWRKLWYPTPKLAKLPVEVSKHTNRYFHYRCSSQPNL